VGLFQLEQWVEQWENHCVLCCCRVVGSFLVGFVVVMERSGLLGGREIFTTWASFLPRKMPWASLPKNFQKLVSSKKAQNHWTMLVGKWFDNGQNRLLQLTAVNVAFSRPLGLYLAR
jgi:hypothetical protein